MQEQFRFIEVISEGEYNEEIEQYVADLRLEVNASTEETALTEIEVLKDKTIGMLLESGLAPEELFDGGMEVWRPWYGKKKTGKQVWYKLTVKHKDAERFSGAISRLEPLFANQRYSFTLDMKQPLFKPEPDGLNKALQQAYLHANESPGTGISRRSSPWKRSANRRIIQSKTKFGGLRG